MAAAVARSRPGQDVLFEGARVDADADGDPPRRRGPDDLADLLPRADVAGIEPQAVDARVEGGQGQPVVEVDVGDERDPALPADLPEGGGRGPVRDGQPDDLRPGLLQPADLRRRRPDVPGVGLGHGLDDDGGAAADDDAAHGDGARSPAREHPAPPSGLERHRGCASRWAAS